MVEYLNNIIPQLEDSFHTESIRQDIFAHSTRREWATIPLKNNPMAWYNYDHLDMALIERIQLEREIEKTSTIFSVIRTRATLTSIGASARVVNQQQGRAQ